MNNRQMFKAGFLAKCVEDGLTLPEIKQRVKQAIHAMTEKKADGILENLAKAPVLGLTKAPRSPSRPAAASASPRGLAPRDRAITRRLRR